MVLHQLQMYEAKSTRVDLTGFTDSGLDMDTQYLAMIVGIQPHGLIMKKCQIY